MAKEEVYKFEETVTKKQAKTAKLKVDDEGTILIEGMDYGKAIVALQRKRDEEERVVSFYEEFRNDHPLDAAVNFTRAIADMFGWVDMRPSPGFFGETPPMMVPVVTGVNETTHVPVGAVHLPGIGEISVNIHFGHKPPFFFVSAETKQKNVVKLKELVARARKFLLEKSIYNGKAIKVTFEWMHPNVKFDIAKHSPQFIDLSNVNEEELIFSRKVERNLRVGLWTSIQRMEALKDSKIPFKRGVLLIGKYGVGKTLAALITAKKANAAGVGFMYLDTVLSLPYALQMIQKKHGGAPWVLFAEDVERVIGGQDRNPEVDLVLNTIDGLDSKDSNIITVFTTNHPREINQAFLRDGRIDKKILITTPDAEATTRLVKIYGRDLLHPDVDLVEAGRVLCGRTPATIRKIVEESKLSAIDRTGGRDVKGKVILDDLIYATEDHDLHEELVKPRGNGKKDLSLHIHVPADADPYDTAVMNDSQHEQLTNGKDQEESELPEY